jgi:Fe-S cluster biogenesis protein NfuA
VTEERATELADVLSVVQEAVAMDGGAVSLLSADYAAGVVRVMLTGACGACALVGATAEQGVERVLKQRLDWVSEVVVVVDESNPTHSLSLGRGGFKPL